MLLFASVIFTVLAGFEDGEIVAFGYGDNYFVVCTLTGVIFGQFLPESSCLSTHDTVVTRVISRSAVEYVDSDMLLGRFVGRTAECAIADVKEEVAQAGRRVEALARRNFFDKNPVGMSSCPGADCKR